MLASAQALFEDIRGGGLEKPYWEAIRAEKSMDRYLRICTDAGDTEQIPGSLGLLCPTEFINKEKDHVLWDRGSSGPIAKGTDLVRKPPSCPFIFP